MASLVGRNDGTPAEARPRASSDATNHYSHFPSKGLSYKNEYKCTHRYNVMPCSIAKSNSRLMKIVFERGRSNASPRNAGQHDPLYRPSPARPVEYSTSISVTAKAASICI